MKNPYWGDKDDSQSKIISTNNSSRAEIYKELAFVETVSNRIYFYSEIGRNEVLQLNRRLRELSNELLVAAAEQERPPAKIFLHINSFGGSIFAGLSSMDEIVSSRASITTIVDGCCASSATFLSVVGKERIIRPNAFMLIHQLQSAFWGGKFRELQDEHKNSEKLMETIKDIYKKHTKIPPEKIDEILDHDLWFDARTCVDYGLVDKIA
jgi:ATP-dependent Clp endopeptidase proteolytic subunit ClpP